MSFVDPSSDWYSASVPVIIYVISCNIGLRVIMALLLWHSYCVFLVPGPCLNIKSVFFRYGDFHYKDKTIVRASYLYNGSPYIGKTTNLYWDGPRCLYKTVTMPSWLYPISSILILSVSFTMQLHHWHCGNHMMMNYIIFFQHHFSYHEVTLKVNVSLI